MTTNEQPTSPTPSRGGVNIIIPDLVLQRAQILSWALDEKREFFRRHNITVVVNFWSKLDADMSECWGVRYLYIPRPSSRGMLDPDIPVLAQAVLQLVRASGGKVLVLCEAGKTRSVYFSLILMSLHWNIPLREALTRLTIKHSLKGFMLDRIHNEPTTSSSV